MLLSTVLIGNFQGISNSKISLQTKFVKYKYFTSIRKIRSTVAIREIKFREMKN